MDLKLLVCFIHKKYLLDEVLAKLIELDVGGATVLNSTGIGRSKAQDMILYEGFKDVMRGAEKDHYTVLCIIKKSKIKKVAAALTELYGDFKEQGIGFFFTVPVDGIWGINLADGNKWKR